MGCCTSGSAPSCLTPRSSKGPLAPWSPLRTPRPLPPRSPGSSSDQAAPAADAARHRATSWSAWVATTCRRWQGSGSRGCPADRQRGSRTPSPTRPSPTRQARTLPRPWGPSTASTVLYSRSGLRKDAAMINGAHAILYSDDAAVTRATLAKVLGTWTVDAGGGWRIFALSRPRSRPPGGAGGRAELYHWFQWHVVLLSSTLGCSASW